jgi:hypothetical protein
VFQDDIDDVVLLMLLMIKASLSSNAVERIPFLLRGSVEIM